MSDNKKDKKPSEIIVEVPERLIGRQIVFRLIKGGGRRIDFSIVKDIRRKGNEVTLLFDEFRQGLGKYGLPPI